MTPTERQHALRGIHSNIPICCVAFFVLTWWPRCRTPQGKADNDRYWRLLDRLCPNAQYVPCPECVRARRFVKIHICTKRCAGQPGACRATIAKIRPLKAAHGRYLTETLKGSRTTPGSTVDSDR